MLKKLKQITFPFIIALSALAVSGSAAYYSVTGLSKLFAGASTEVLIMAGSLEIAKLVIASLLYQYWSQLNKILRTYLSIACVVLVLITSMGIYGFLSAAYQETYSELAIVENKKQFLNKKIEFYEKDVARYDQELETILSNINNLSTAKSRSIQVRDTTSQTGYRNTISTSELRLAQKRIAVEEENKKQTQSLRQKATDSLQKYKLQVLNLSNSSDQAGELGPLKYLAGLTGYSMDKVINILLLVIIFVFDPLAISLVVAANFAFEKAFPKKKEKLFEELEDDFTEWDDLDEEDNHPKPNEALKDAAKRYKDLDTNKDGIVDNKEIRDRIKSLNNQLATGLSAWRSRKIKEEIAKLKSQLPNEEGDVKIY
jgi:hypothetical protein